MCPWLARAANAATLSATPSRSTRNRATSSAVGVASDTLRQRDRIVGSTSSTVGAHSTHTVFGVGSSIALRSVLPVRPTASPRRSASSMIITWKRRSTGASAERCTSSRMSLM